MEKNNNPSSHHHYIPEFFTKGFCNEMGMVYVYNKKTGRISKKLRSPKSIFYETHRNSLIKDGVPDSFLEDEYFKALDNTYAKTLLELRNLPNVDGLLTFEKALTMQSFMLNLFWRIPFSDSIFDDLFDRAIFKAKPGGTILDMKSDTNFKKIRRSIFANEIIREWIDSKPTEGIPAALFDRVDQVFLTSDNPIIFKNTPKHTDELFKSEYFMAISSSRMYCTIKDQNKHFEDRMSIAYNILQIAQARKFVCGHSLEILEWHVNRFNILKGLKMLSNVIEILFEKK